MKNIIAGLALVATMSPAGTVKAFPYTCQAVSNFVQNEIEKSHPNAIALDGEAVRLTFDYKNGYRSVYILHEATRNTPALYNVCVVEITGTAATVQDEIKTELSVLKKLIEHFAHFGELARVYVF